MLYFSHINAEYVPAELQDHVGHMVAHGQVVGHTLCYINSAINPLVYYFMSEAFKNRVNICNLVMAKRGNVPLNFIVKYI